ncbi:hypothetical protein AA983_12170 [Dermacoccus sp. PE3]|uniref:metallophosphoesterase n=1 Tax=Dermacoccus sp. PE3 TaxID=1641401 RepID=UPI000641B3EA|nr:metallophosphoesterase [Dermacoccus sp. PE3]KLO62318.1 hypothetical protein AA983_12170 [Dermacoccus sp. PE3]
MSFHRPSTSNAALRTAAGAVAAGVGALAWGTLVERNWYALRRFEMPVLAPGSAPLRVLHVSDLHIVPRQERRIQWVRELARLEPDFVINTGDNLSDEDAIPSALRAMEPLMAFPGAFVFGSNDYFYPKLKNPLRYFDDSHAKGEEMGVGRFDVEPLRSGFTGGGWLDLTHRRERVEVAGVPLELVGVDDPHLEYDEYDTVSAEAASRRGEVAATIGVVHAPYTRVLDAMTADGADAVIAGHTHGGQLCVPFHGALVTNCDLDTSRVKGVSRWWPGASGVDSTLAVPIGPGALAPGGSPLGSAAEIGERFDVLDAHRVHNDSVSRSEATARERRRTALPSSAAPDDAAWLHVSAGLGHNKYTPVRFACRPEATLITLTAKAH